MIIKIEYYNEGLLLKRDYLFFGLILLFRHECRYGLTNIND